MATPASARTSAASACSWRASAETAPVRTVNRQCSSGLQAVADVAASIAAGFYDVGVAAGVETMTVNPMKWEGGMNPRVASSSAAQSCLIPMGVTSENVAAKWRISRETQDAFSAPALARAAAARRKRTIRPQIVPSSIRRGETRRRGKCLRSS